MNGGEDCCTEDDCASYYAALGVSDCASAAEVRAAYLRACLAHHPDRGGCAARLDRARRAWDVLGDARARRAYDAARGGAGGVVGDRVARAELVDVDGGRGWECRCGGWYVVDARFVAGVSRVACDGCSLWLELW